MFGNIPLVQKQLLALIRLAITGNTDHSLTEYAIDWKAVYGEAKKHCLLGIVFAGIEQLPEEKRPETAFLMNWIWQAQRIKEKNEKTNKRVVELSETVRKAGLKYVILKGQGVAQLYKVTSGSKKFQGVPRNSKGSKAGTTEGVGHSGTTVIADLRQLRTSGDIDIWIKGSRKEILKFANKQGNVDRIVYHNVETNIFPDVSVEIHFTPSWLCNYFRNRKLQKWFRNNFEECFKNKITLENTGEISIPTLRFNRVFILQHIYRHLFGDGIGLRQLIDYYFVLVKSYESCDEEQWSQEKAESFKIIKQLGMAKFCGAVMWIIHEYFGMDEKCLLCAPNNKEGIFLLDEILKAGNFGHADNRIVHSENENKLHSFFRITRQNLRFIKHYPNEVLWNPVYRAWHYAWRKYKGYKI